MREHSTAASSVLTSTGTTPTTRSATTGTQGRPRDPDSAIATDPRLGTPEGSRSNSVDNSHLRAVGWRYSPTVPRLVIVLVTMLLAVGVVLAVIFGSTWADTVPTWLSGVGGILGALASIYAITIAVQADTEHVAWRTNVTKTSAKGVPSAYEAVNLSKGTVANLLSVEDITGDHSPALGFHVPLPVDVPPGTGVPMAIERTLANSYPTLVRLEWTERRARSNRGSKRVYSQTLFL